MNLLEEFLTLAQARGLGTYEPSKTTGTLFLDELPDAPDAAIALARYPGPEADAGLGYDEVRLQFRIRAGHADRRVGMDLAQRVYDELHGLPSQLLPGGTRLIDLIGLHGGPVYIGKDAKHRPEWTVNFRSELRNQSVHRS